jgi:putative ABC transport system permease protein
MTGPEVSEIAIRVQSGGAVDKVSRQLETSLSAVVDRQGKPALEVHPWQKLTPFASIAGMIDLLTLFIKVMLVSIVLVSVMNVMIMAVYERIREIGTIAAIGTRPSRVLVLFLSEGLLLGVAGTAAGTAISLVAIYLVNLAKLTFSFGQQSNILLSASIGAVDVITIAVMVIAVALLATLQPAWKASRMDPITALRHV